MPRPPAPGVYSIKLRDGTGYVAQFAKGGRMVELLGPVTLSSPPKRRTVSYLGESWAGVLHEREERRRLALLDALYGGHRDRA